MNVKIMVLRDTMLYSQIHRYQRFGAACYFHLQDRRETENSFKILVLTYQTTRCHVQKDDNPLKKYLNLKRMNQVRNFVLHNKELCGLFMLPRLVRTVKCRKVARNVYRMRETKNVCRSLVEKSL
jgi:hypothetical protein